MKIVGAIVVIIFAIILYLIVCKIVCWMFDFEKKTDEKMFKMEMEDYDNDKWCAIANVTIVFVVITVGLMFLLFTRW